MTEKTKVERGLMATLTRGTQHYSLIRTSGSPVLLLFSNIKDNSFSTSCCRFSLTVLLRFYTFLIVVLIPITIANVLRSCFIIATKTVIRFHVKLSVSVYLSCSVCNVFTPKHRICMTFGMKLLYSKSKLRMCADVLFHFPWQITAVYLKMATSIEISTNFSQ